MTFSFKLQAELNKSQKYLTGKDQSTGFRSIGSLLGNITNKLQNPVHKAAKTLNKEIVPQEDILANLGYSLMSMPQSDRDALNSLIYFDNKYPNIKVSQDTIANNNMTRQTANRSLKRLEKVGFISAAQEKFGKCCSYFVSSIFRRPDIRTKLAKILPNLALLPIVWLLASYSNNVDNGKYATLYIRELLRKNINLIQSESEMVSEAKNPVPEYVREIKSLDLYVLGQCILSKYSENTIRYAESVWNSMRPKGDPFAYYVGICEYYSNLHDEPKSPELTGLLCKLFNCLPTAPLCKQSVEDSAIQKKTAITLPFGGNLTSHVVTPKKEPQKRELQSQLNLDSNHIDNLQKDLDAQVRYDAIKNAPPKEPKITADYIRKRQQGFSPAVPEKKRDYGTREDAITKFATFADSPEGKKLEEQFGKDFLLMVAKCMINSVDNAQ